MQQISSQLRNPALACTENFTAVAPASLFGVDLSRTLGLVLAYYGGTIFVHATGSDYEQRPDGSIELPPSEAAVYVEADADGVVSYNTSGFTPGAVPLYQAVTSASAITSLVDMRIMLPQFSEAGTAPIVVLTQAEYDALSPPVATRLYVTSDMGNIYLGTMPLAGSST